MIPMGMNTTAAMISSLRMWLVYSLNATSRISPTVRGRSSMDCIAENLAVAAARYRFTWMRAMLERDDPNWEVAAAWIAKELLRDVYRAVNVAHARRVMIGFHTTSTDGSESDDTLNLRHEYEITDHDSSHWATNAGTIG